MIKAILAGLIIISLAFLYWAENTSNSYDKESPSEQLSISRYELLHASDVMEAVTTAIKRNELENIKQQQQAIVGVAEQMGFDDSDIAFLSGSQAYDYLVFQGKRALFEEAVINSYINLVPIDDAKLAFPEAQDRFSKADEVLAQRDRLFSQLVDTLKREGLDPQIAEREAATLWRERFKASDMQNILGQ